MGEPKSLDFAETVSAIITKLEATEGIKLCRNESETSVTRYRKQFQSVFLLNLCMLATLLSTSLKLKAVSRGPVPDP